MCDIRVFISEYSSNECWLRVCSNNEYNQVPDAVIKNAIYFKNICAWLLSFLLSKDVHLLLRILLLLVSFVWPSTPRQFHIENISVETFRLCGKLKITLNILHILCWVFVQFIVITIYFDNNSIFKFCDLL